MRLAFSEQRAANAKSSATRAIKVDSDDMEFLESCQFLTASSDGKTLLGAWKLRQKSWSRIMCLDVKINSSKATERDYGLALSPSEPIDALDPYVIDFCKAPVDRYHEENVPLYH